MDGSAASISTSHGMRCFFGMVASDSAPATMPLYDRSQPLRRVPAGPVRCSVVQQAHAALRAVSQQQARIAQRAYLAAAMPVTMRRAAVAKWRCWSYQHRSRRTIACRLMSISAGLNAAQVLLLGHQGHPPAHRQRAVLSGMSGCGSLSFLRWRGSGSALVLAPARRLPNLAATVSTAGRRAALRWSLRCLLGLLLGAHSHGISGAYRFPKNLAERWRT